MSHDDVEDGSGIKTVEAMRSKHGLSGENSNWTEDSKGRLSIDLWKQKLAIGIVSLHGPNEESASPITVHTQIYIISKI